MKIVSSLRTGPKLKAKKAEKIAKKLHKHKKLKKYFFVILRKNHHNLLELVECKDVYFLESFNELHILGIVKEQADGVHLLYEIISDVAKEYTEITQEKILNLFK